MEVSLLLFSCVLFLALLPDLCLLLCVRVCVGVLMCAIGPKRGCADVVVAPLENPQEKIVHVHTLSVESVPPPTLWPYLGVTCYYLNTHTHTTRVCLNRGRRRRLKALVSKHGPRGAKIYLYLKITRRGELFQQSPCEH